MNERASVSSMKTLLYIGNLSIFMIGLGFAVRVKSRIFGIESTLPTCNS